VCLCVCGVFVCEVRVGEYIAQYFIDTEEVAVFVQSVPSALTCNCVYSAGKHVILICSRSAAVLPLYVVVCSTLSQAIDMCMSILWSVYILPAHLPPTSLMHLSVRLTYMSFLNSNRKEVTCFLYVWGRDSMSVWYIMLLNVRLMLPFPGSIALHAKVIILLTLSHAR